MSSLNSALSAEHEIRVRDSHGALTKKDHLDFIDEVETLIFNDNFDELINYTNFSLCILRDTLMRSLFQSNNKKIIKYIINNIYSVSKSGVSVIHYLSAYLGNKKLVDYFIEKYQFNLELSTIAGSKPIHCACVHNSSEVIDYLIHKGVDLNSTNNNGSTAIQLIIRNHPYDTIKYFLNKLPHDNNIKDLIIEKNSDITTKQKLELLEIIFRKEHGLV